MQENQYKFRYNLIIFDNLKDNHFLAKDKKFQHLKDKLCQKVGKEITMHLVPSILPHTVGIKSNLKLKSEL